MHGRVSNDVKRGLSSCIFRGKHVAEILLSPAYEAHGSMTFPSPPYGWIGACDRVVASGMVVETRSPES